MTDRPIIFSAPMVRALLDGRKTQTRRLRYSPSGAGQRETPFRGMSSGDRLWVRENWAHDAPDLDTCRRGVESGGPPHGPYYRATSPDWEARTLKWRPSIHMPRWASRLTLTLTAVRVQRLQEISEEDAVAEGITRSDRGGWWDGASYHGCRTPLLAFTALWDNIHGPDAWDANPFVVALSFTVERRNIDHD